MNKQTDVVIIGAGIAGMTAAMYLKRSGINSIVIEKELAGGLLNKMSLVENYPGVTSTTGMALANIFYEQTTKIGIEYTYDEVLKINLIDDNKIIETKKGKIKTKAIIIATGRIPKRLNRKDEDNLYGNGISFCSVCDGPLYKKEDVAIIGGGNSALEESLYLSKICNKVTIINRSSKLKGEIGLVERVLKQKNIKILYNSEIKKFIEKDNKLDCIEIATDKKIKKLKVKACFIFIGYEPNTSFLSDLEILDEKGYIIVNEEMSTKIKGIFAAGDVVKKDLFQLVTAASDGAKAAISCVKYLK